MFSSWIYSSFSIIVRNGVKNRCVASVAMKELSHDRRSFHATTFCSKDRDRRDFLKTYRGWDEGTEGERLQAVDVIKKKDDMFPNEDTPNLLFNGVKFSNIPILNIKVTKNNTIMNLTDNIGKPIMYRTCGIEGFKHSRKGTNVAAQATAITFAKNVIKNGIVDVRVKIRGLGPGRASSIRGLTMTGVNIISITDETRVPVGKYGRPRKVRRV